VAQNITLMSYQAGGMTPEEFVEKWSKAQLSERAASHEHFLDLCRLLGQPTPAQADSTGEDYCFEKHVKVVGAASKGSKGDTGFVDVWKRGFFAWEYKRKDKHKSLDEAYRQLYQYRDDLDNPPLSVVCDIRTTEIRVHFPGYPTAKTVVKLEEIPGRLEVLRRIFTSPISFRPTKTREQETSDLADVFGELADKLLDRAEAVPATLWHGHGDPVAHFLMKVMFCLFAEDVGLLPDKLFTDLINRCLFSPEQFKPACAELFEKMKSGGYYGNDKVDYFNGGLFDDAPPLTLNAAELAILAKVATRPWQAVEPSIFGTLFERILDPKKRAQIGAHYTSKTDILLVVDPVVMTPLRRKWSALQEQIAPEIQRTVKENDRKKRDVIAAPVRIALDGLRKHLGEQRILDPACGSGNFLYVALQQLLDLDDEVVRFAARHDITLSPLPYIRPTQLHGIEINPYAAELAQNVIWIGYLQWLVEHHISNDKRPILDKLVSIENRDAILDLSKPNLPVSAEWPEADFVIGNPPFLGDKMMRRGLGDAYVETLRRVYDELPGGCDLCCYWFELARKSIDAFPKTRAGLLATQNIRGGANRRVLDRIKHTGNIFYAVSDHNWVLDGATVHVSMVGFDADTEKERFLDQNSVREIKSNLSSSSADVTLAKPIEENVNIAFLGSCKGGSFDISFAEARRLVAEAGNPNDRSNSDVLRPVVNSKELLGRVDPRWIIDTADLTLQDASRYVEPQRIIEQRVRPERAKNRDKWLRENWWRPQRMRPEMRRAIGPLTRFIVTPTTSKYRAFAWMPAGTLPDHQLIVFARADDYAFGLLHSSVHEIWARRTGTQLREAESGFRYTPSSTFDTFPFPWPPGKEDAKHPAYVRIAEVAKKLNEQRELWLNPPEWIEPLAAKIDAADKFDDVPPEARALVRQSAIKAAAAKDSRLKKRTLTNLYNERPTWLKIAHEQLDRAVLAAYASTDPDGKWNEDWAEVWFDSGAGQPLATDHSLAAKRSQVDQKVLANLLALNHLRAGKEARTAAMKAPRSKIAVPQKKRENRRV